MDKNSIVVQMKAQKQINYYEAKAKYYGDKIVVLKGSKIALKVNQSYRLAELISEMRKDITTVSEDGILLKDIEFTNASRAACFVAGYSVNGLNCWKTTDGLSIKQYKEKNNGKNADD